MSKFEERVIKGDFFWKVPEGPVSALTGYALASCAAGARDFSKKVSLYDGETKHGQRFKTDPPLLTHHLKRVRGDLRVFRVFSLFHFWFRKESKVGHDSLQSDSEI